MAPSLFSSVLSSSTVLAHNSILPFSRLPLPRHWGRDAVLTASTRLSTAATLWAPLQFCLCFGPRTQTHTGPICSRHWGEGGRGRKNIRKIDDGIL